MGSFLLRYKIRIRSMRFTMKNHKRKPRRQSQKRTNGNKSHITIHTLRMDLTINRRMTITRDFKPKCMNLAISGLRQRPTQSHISILITTLMATTCMISIIPGIRVTIIRRSNVKDKGTDSEIGIDSDSAKKRE